jgi:hypothetical protein
MWKVSEGCEAVIQSEGEGRNDTGTFCFDRAGETVSSIMNKTFRR